MSCTVATPLAFGPVREARPVRRDVRVGPADQPSLRLTRRGRVVVAALALVGAAAVGLSAQSAVADAPSAPVEVVAHTVQPGETLWAIAGGVAGPHEDVRDVIDEIAELNGLEGTALVAGQQVLVPSR